MKCVYIPNKGEKLFLQLKKQFGYEMAKNIFLRAINPKFISDYKNTLSLDAEGVPSLESIMSNTWMKNFIGEETILNSLNKYEAKDDTIDNFTSLLEEAKQFNLTSPHKKDFIASVEYTEDNKIKIEVSRKTQEKIDRFNNQFGVHSLNRSLQSIFNSLGITMGHLTRAEQESGRVGHIDFSKAKEMASGFTSMIRVANNIEGYTAVSEEFSHLIIEVFKNDGLVSRSLNTLRLDPNALIQILGDQYYDIYEYHNGNMDLIAEEALGHLLQKNLIKQSIPNVPQKNIIKRAIDYIINKFKSFKIHDVNKAVAYADNAMSQLARNIIDKKVEITKESVSNINREDTFNALSDRVERNINILKGAIEIELKRYKISEDADPDFIKKTIQTLKGFTKEDSDTVQGLLTYAKTAVASMRYLQDGFLTIDIKSIPEASIFLRKVSQYLQSYGDFISALNSAINEEVGLEDNMFNREIEVDGSSYKLSTILKELNSLTSIVESNFKKNSIAMFEEFCKPYLEGTGIVAKEIIAQSQGDISFMDRWLDSMGMSSDILLQVFDSAVKQAKDRARVKTIKDIQKIQDWRLRVEKASITTFERFFEVDGTGRKTGNYISEVNIGEFERQKELMLKSLDEKYGKNPKGEEAKLKIKEKEKWMEENAIEVYGIIYPNPKVYRNEDYFKLSDTEVQLLEEYKELKRQFDSYIPEKKRNSNLAIQMRKSRGQRIMNSIGAITSPSVLFDNIKEGFKSGFYDSEDDDQIFGATVRNGLTNFDGSEYMVLPLNYLTKLKNTEELSTDLAASLIAYAYMTNQYSELENIVNPLEIGRTIVKEYRSVKKTRGSSPLLEKVTALGNTVYKDILHSEGTNIVKKLDDFMESQIYQRYIKDEGVVGKFNIAKTVDRVLEASALAQLGCNWLANLANITQGLCMQRIEVAAGQYFNRKEIAFADKEYAIMLKDFIPEVGARLQNSKMALLGNFFNIKQDFKDKTRRAVKKNLLERIFGADIAYLGQEAGDHWLYYRTAIAYMKHTKIIVDGKETTVWDAIGIRNSEVNSEIKEMYMPEAYYPDGKKFDVAKFGRKIAHINHSLFGIYNEEDANAANRVALGRILMQFRKWMKPLYNRRFQAKQYVLEMENYEEGYYRTLLRVLKQLKRGEVQIGMLKDQLSETDFANCKRAIIEVMQFFVVLAAVKLIDWPDDEDRPWSLKLAEYTAHRLAHELGGLTPSPTMITETLKTMKTPAAVLSTLQNTANLVISVVTPEDYIDEIQSGPYKGMSTIEKNFIKAPIPVISQFRQIQKFTGDLDTSILYYLRPY